ncbi:MAG: hypothetical protein NVS9B15_18470 [Acidobacteriaceae bacterium]
MRRSYVIALLLVLAAIVGSGWWLYSRLGPPKITELLPEADSIAYADVQPVRAATHFDEKWDLEHDSAYTDFSNATRIQVSRDLDEVTLAIGGTPNDRRFSEVMRGKFDRAKLEAWLKMNAASTENYSGHAIYTVIHEGRPDRISILDARTVLGSNTPDSAPIHSMLDRANSPAAPELLKRNYAAIPKASPVWWIRRYQDDEPPALTLGDQSVTLGMPSNTTIIASLRYLTSLEARVLAITPSDLEAQRTASNWTSALHLARSLSRATHSKDALSQVLSTAVINQQGSNVSVTTTLPKETIEELAHSLQQSPQR